MQNKSKRKKKTLKFRRVEISDGDFPIEKIVAYQTFNVNIWQIILVL